MTHTPYRLACVLLVCAVAAWGRARGGPQEPISALPRTPREVWAVDLLKRLGNERPTGETVAMVAAWETEENTGAAFNPLATSQDMPGATLFNSSRVKNYPDYETGIEATAKTLGYVDYTEVLAGLQTNDPERALVGLSASPWAEEAGYGSRVRALWEGETRVEHAPRVSSIRAQIVNDALAQVGKAYILGSAGPDTFDCSGLVQWVYAKQGIATGRTTFDQLERLPAVAPGEIEEGDLIYFAFPWDQHVGILADSDSDGRWDMVNAGAPGIGVVVTQDVFSDPFWTGAIIGYRRAV